MEKLKTNQDEQVFAFARKAQNDIVVVLINLHQTPVNFMLEVPVGEEQRFAALQDIFAHRQFFDAKTRGMKLEGYGYGVYVVR